MVVGEWTVLFDYSNSNIGYVCKDGTKVFALPHQYKGYDSAGMLMMTAGINYAFSPQCAVHRDNKVYYRDANQRLIRFTLDANNQNVKVLFDSEVRDFTLENDGEFVLMSFKGKLKRVKLDNVDGPQPITTTLLKEIQLTNGQSSTTHWTTFCRLGKHTCVAGHDSSVSPYNTFLEVVAESNTDFTVLPIRATFTNNNSSCK